MYSIRKLSTHFLLNTEYNKSIFFNNKMSGILSHRIIRIPNIYMTNLSNSVETKKTLIFTATSSNNSRYR